MLEIHTNPTLKPLRWIATLTPRMCTVTTIGYASHEPDYAIHRVVQREPLPAPLSFRQSDLPESVRRYADHRNHSGKWVASLLSHYFDYSRELKVDITFSF